MGRNNNKSKNFGSNKSKKQFFATKLVIEQEEEKITDERLGALSLRRKPLPKDGSCLFRGCAEQLFHTQHYHQYVRAKCVDFLEQNRLFFEHYIVEMPFKDYCKWMRHETRWGGQIELECIAQQFKCNIRVYSSRGIEAEHTYHGNDKKDVPTLKLCFMHGNHYDSVYDVDFFVDAAFCQEIFYQDILNKGLGIDVPAIPNVPNGWNVTGLNQRGIYRNIEYDVWQEEVKKRHERDERLAISMNEKKKKSKENFPELKQNSPFVENNIETGENKEQNEDQQEGKSTWSQPKEWDKIFADPPAAQEPVQEQIETQQQIIEDAGPIDELIPVVVGSHDLTVKIKQGEKTLNPKQTTTEKKKKNQSTKNKNKQPVTTIRIEEAQRIVVEEPTIESEPVITPTSVWAVEKEWKPVDNGAHTLHIAPIEEPKKSKKQKKKHIDKQLKEDENLAKFLSEHPEEEQETQNGENGWHTIEKKAPKRAPLLVNRGRGRSARSKF